MIYTLKVTVGIGVNIRSGPSAAHARVGGLYYGDVREADQVSTKGDGEIWYKLKGTSYWVCAYRPSVDNYRYIQVISQVNDAPVNTSPPPPPPAPSSNDSASNPVLGKEYTLDPFANYGGISDADIKYGSGFKQTSNVSHINATYAGIYNSQTIKTKNVLDDPSYQRLLQAVKTDLNANYFPSVEHLNLALATNYNLYDIPFPDYDLTKSFTRIFITRPDLNFFSDDRSKSINDKIYADPTYNYIYGRNPLALKELTLGYKSSHDINMTLSNAAKSIDISDEMIETQDIGETVLGFKMMYGRSIHKSMTASTININFKDDQTLLVYNMLTAWVKYISDVFHGMHSPKTKYIRRKELDYASSIYYFVVAADGETILYAMKYYGVFPINIPSSNFSKSAGGGISDLNYNIQFAYCFKDPINSLSLAELNRNTIFKNDPTFSTSTAGIKARSLYNTLLGHAGNTFVGMPFIMEDRTKFGNRIFKLKYTPAETI